MSDAYVPPGEKKRKRVAKKKKRPSRNTAAVAVDISVEDDSLDPLTSAKLKFSTLLAELLSSTCGSESEEGTLTNFALFMKDTLLSSKPEIFNPIFNPVEKEGSSRRPTRIPGLSTTKHKFFSKKRKRSELVHDLLTSSDSVLCSVPLTNIINAKTFNLMVPAIVKDSLATLLPECDTQSHETITQMFTNPEFIHSLMLFQRHLHGGTFDTGDGTRRSKKTKDIEPWKLDHFEHVWGQRLLSDCLLEEPTKTTLPFSYTDPELCDLAIFAEPMSEISSVSVQDVRRTMAERDTSDPFTMIFGDKMEHFRRRKVVVHRNPYNELFLRSTNITNRHVKMPDYGNAEFKDIKVTKWNKEITKIRQLQNNHTNPDAYGTREENHITKKDDENKDKDNDKELSNKNKHKDNDMPSNAPTTSQDAGTTESATSLNSTTKDKPPPPTKKENIISQVTDEVAKLPIEEKPDEPMKDVDVPMVEASSIPHPVKVQSAASNTHPVAESNHVAENSLKEEQTGISNHSIFPPIMTESVHLPMPRTMKGSPMDISNLTCPNSPTPLSVGVSLSEIENNVHTQATAALAHSCETLQGTSTNSFGTTSDASKDKLTPTFVEDPILTKPLDDIPEKSAAPSRQESQTPSTIGTTNILESDAQTQIIPPQPVPSSSTPTTLSFPNATSSTLHMAVPSVPTTASASDPVQSSFFSSTLTNIQEPIQSQPPNFIINETLEIPAPVDAGSDEEYVPAPEPKRTRKSSTPRREKPSFRTAAYNVLKRENRPLPAKDIVAIGLRDNLFKTSGKTPENTLASILYKDIQQKQDSLFVKLNMKPVAFALREWNLTSPQSQ